MSETKNHYKQIGVPANITNVTSRPWQEQLLQVFTRLARYESNCSYFTVSLLQSVSLAVMITAAHLNADECQTPQKSARYHAACAISITLVLCPAAAVRKSGSAQYIPDAHAVHSGLKGLQLSNQLCMKRTTPMKFQ